MRQNRDKDDKSIRHAGGIRADMCLLGMVAIAMIVFTSSVAVAQSQAQTQGQTPAQAASTATNAKEDGSLTPEQILALFQREARAAYQMNKEACAGLGTEQKQVCLARARLQFDADMRYAQKRADQGY